MREYDWPFEIRGAVEALESDAEWTILAATVDGPQTFEDLQRILEGAAAEDVDEAVSNLAAGGLIQKRSRGSLADPHAYRVERSEYGVRFVDAMFGTLNG